MIGTRTEDAANKIVLKRLGYDDIDWIYLAEDRI